MHDIAELISLGLSPSTISLAGLVVWLFFNKAANSFFIRYRVPAQWVALGIAISFLGSMLDNAYWVIPWTAKYLDHPTAPGLVNIGVYFNILFRQASGLIAGYCHVRSVFEFVGQDCVETQAAASVRFLNLYFAVSLLVGAIYVAILILTKTYKAG